MRLGSNHTLFRAEHTAELEPLCEKLDVYGLSTINAPARIGEMTADECAEFGEKACALGLTIGEVGYWENLMTNDDDARKHHIATVKQWLINADEMHCGSVITLVGGTHPSGRPAHPHPDDPYMFSAVAKSAFRDIVLRILDSLELRHTHYIIEPWHNTFFYQPESIHEFIVSVDHPRFGVHLDQMNMVTQASYYATTDLINRTFDLLADHAFSIHLKDILMTRGPGDFFSMKEVRIGEGSMDYPTFIKRLAALPPDIPCYCEHLDSEGDYAINFARLHHTARESGNSFIKRKAPPGQTSKEQ
jgi:sugar phosphate isomerase/epimerase